MRSLSVTAIALGLINLTVLLPVWAQDQVYSVDGKPATEKEYQASQLIARGLVFLRQNQNAEAADLFAKAVQLGPNLPSGHVDYAIALGKMNKPAEAIQELKQAVQLDPNQPAAWLNLGGLYQTQGQIEQALAALKEFIARFPNHPDAGKVRSLIQGLNKLKATLPPTAGSLANPNELPGSSGSGSGEAAQAQMDYFAEATPRGTLRWPPSSMPIRVFVRPGTAVPSFKPEFDSILVRAFKDWETGSDDKVKFSFVDNPANANIECRWSADPSQLSNSAEAGETKLVLKKSDIVRASIVILTVPLVSALPLTGNRLRMTCLHEIGHALGLTGHTRNPDDVMFYSSHIADTWFDLSQRDKNTIVRLYSVPASQ
jgi:tetratricopeptide (TPR) repeat protein